MDTGPNASLCFAPLPERARERGAPSHWLGTIGTTQPDRVTSQMASSGGRVLEESQGSDPTVLLDPHGSILSIGAGSRITGTSPVGWHLLNTTSLEPAWHTYSDAFGWRALDEGRLSAELGAFRTFAWSDGGSAVGMIAETARAPHIHTHWLFHLDVFDLDEALELFRIHGGQVVTEPMDTPAGRISACDDPTGAAIALRQPPA